MVAPGVPGTARHVEHAFIRRERDENGGMDALFNQHAMVYSTDAGTE